MDAAVSPKTARRRGVTSEHVPRGPVSEEQRSRRAVFGETLRVESLLPLGFVPPPPQIAADMPRRRSAPKVKIPLSGGVHSF